MYDVLAPVMYVVFIKSVCRSHDFDLLEFLAKFYVFTYVVFMVVYGRGFSFSLAEVVMDDYGPFSGDSRIIHARSIFMMIIPLLWYLHQYLSYKKLIPGLLFLFCAGVILIHQHRSVWSSAILSVAIYLGASIRAKRIKLSSIGSFVAYGVILLSILLFFVSSIAPGFLEFMGDRFSEILNPSKEGGTGSFRFLQRETYSKLAMQHPYFGWTFKGFEMPNPLVDWWPAMSGQHFHEGYVEMLFYHGIVGLIFKYSFLIYLIFKIFSKKLSAEAIIMSALCLSGLLFSFSYVLPLIFWGHVGLALYYIERDDTAWKNRFSTISHKI
ncbi:MAG: O-antigen ligase domain-containing protein [Sphingobacteriaceae bacterium]|nr:MAG: O-antigen ligase domain-containing protein [Sphingobacteriaceae bacterium]